MNDIEREISEILLVQPIRLDILRSYARKPGGFQCNKLRAKVWPKLLNINRYDLPDYREYLDPHRDIEQVSRDVERSLWNYEGTNSEWGEEYRERRRQVLADIIMAILCKNNSLFYYQGFHDFVSVLMLVLEDDLLTFTMAETVGKLFMVDYMRQDFETISKFIPLIFVILKTADLPLYNHLQAAKLEPFFATSWLITWFAHDLKSLDECARIFDVMLSSPPIYSFYLCAAYLISLREVLLKKEADFAVLHDTIGRAIDHYGFPTEDLIKSADNLFTSISVTRLMITCDKKLHQLVMSQEISFMSRPYFQIMEVDCDWTLLENMKLVPINKYNPLRGTLRLLWSHGWTLSFLSKNPLESNIHREKDKESLRSTVEHIWHHFIWRLKCLRLNSRKSNFGTIGKALFWSIAVVVGGILGYSVMFDVGIIGRKSVYK